MEDREVQTEPEEKNQEVLAERLAEGSAASADLEEGDQAVLADQEARALPWPEANPKTRRRH